jgi:hypothetical protein
VSEQFNPRAAVKSIRRGTGGYQYLQVQDRVRWFKTENPEGTVQSELVRWDAEFGVAVVLATVTAPGLGLAQGLGSACRKDLEGKVAAKQAQPDQIESYVEFAETAAVGRALGRLGYGTEDALDVTPVDSPHEQTPAPQEQRPREQPPERRAPREVPPTAPTPIRAAAPPAGAVSESASSAASTHEQHNQIRDLVGPAGMTIDALLQTQGMTSLADMSAAKAERVIARLKARAATPDANSPVADTPRLVTTH